jgi:spore germination protein YaaH
MNRKLLLLGICWMHLSIVWVVQPEWWGAGRLCAQTQDTPFWPKIKKALQPNHSNQPESITEKYGLVYDWIHQKEKKLYDSLSQLGLVNWDRYQNIIQYQYTASQDSLLSGPLAKNVTVFGWHPYWMGNAYESYRFNLLSYLAWFSYNIDPKTGNCDNPDLISAWKNAAVVPLAHAKGCKVLLTITSHTKEGNALFLKSLESQQNLIQQLIPLLAEKEADGVDVNFENVPNGLARNMTLFLKNLSQQLKKYKYTLTVDLPIIDFNHIYELDQLQNDVDLFIVTGYDYFNGQSRTDGPVAPLDGPWGSYNIKQSVDLYLQTGISKKQLLLGLPYYGAVWAGKQKQGTHGQLDTNLNFVGHMTYRALKGKYCKDEVFLDPLSYSKYYWAQPFPDSNYYEKCWFDDSLTLSQKFGWVIKEEMAGVGIWALGYDNGYPELWGMIAAQYGQDSIAVYKEPFIESRYFHLSKSLAQYKSLIAVSGIFLVAFILLGLVVALFDWRVREVFFQQKTLRLLYALGGAGILLSVASFYLFSTEKLVFEKGYFWYLFIGIILGAFIAALAAWWFDKKRSKTP